MFHVFKYLSIEYINHLESSLPCLLTKLFSETSIFCRDNIKLSSTSSDMQIDDIIDLSSNFGEKKRRFRTK